MPSEETEGKYFTDDTEYLWIQGAESVLAGKVAMMGMRNHLANVLMKQFTALMNEFDERENQGEEFDLFAFELRLRKVDPKPEEEG